LGEIFVDVYVFLFYAGCIIFIGFLFGKIADRFHLPEITGYVFAGLLIGPSIFNFISEEVVTGFEIINSVVLGIIAYQIGTELWLPKLKKSGKSILVITFVQAFLTAFLVFSVIYIIDGRLWLALTLSAIATATAPAAMMVIIKKYKAKGPITDTVVPIVGIDDIFGVIIFALFTSISVSAYQAEAINISAAVIDSLVEISLSIVVGIVFGGFLGVLSTLFITHLQKKDKYIAYLTFSLAAVLISVYIAHRFHLSNILTPMMIGMMFTNVIKKESFDIQEAALSNFSGPFIILFFTLAGAQLSLSVLRDAGLISLLYITLRLIGKIGGSYLGARMIHAPKSVRHGVGLSILPQGGVEIGMLVSVSIIFPTEAAVLIKAVVLSGVLFFQFLGPMLFKWTLEHYGEIKVVTVVE
jgi:Kef-type K+ transport system membrane component KefB